MKILENKFIWIKYKNNSYEDLKQTIIDRSFKINSSFKIVNNKFCYKNIEGKFIPFVFDEKELNFDIDKDIFCKFILKIIKKWMNRLSFLYKTEQIQYSPDINDNSLIKKIEIWLNTLHYQKKLNPIDISCYISFKILTHHYFTNGNKRISIMFLTDMLEYLHLFLSYSNMFADKTSFENRWYVLFTDYVKKHEENKHNDESLYNSFRHSVLDGIFLDIRSIKNKLI